MKAPQYTVVPWAEPLPRVFEELRGLVGPEGGFLPAVATWALELWKGPPREQFTAIRVIERIVRNGQTDAAAAVYERWGTRGVLEWALSSWPELRGGSDEDLTNY